MGVGVTRLKGYRVTILRCPQLAHATRVGKYCSVRKILCLLVSLTLAGCDKAPPPPVATTPPPTREAFHAAKPLRVVLTRATNNETEQPSIDWLTREVTYLLQRGQMRIAAESQARGATFVLELHLLDDSGIKLRLIAPDGVLEREREITVSDPNRLGTIGALAASLPSFLDASHTARDWTAFVGTEDEGAYASYLGYADALYGPASAGVTQPVASSSRARMVERLESLTRAQPRFARAHAALAVGYLSLGGDDFNSLTALAESRAEQALAMDDALAEAHAALGVVDFRRNEWIGSKEKFEWALSLDANQAIALEGLTCLNADAGHYAQALVSGIRIAALQPKNTGAVECLTYARFGAQAARTPTDAENLPIAAARVRALAAFLKEDRAAAERLLRSAVSAEEFRLWGAALARAAGNPRHAADALRAVTRAANEGYLDASTEILCGAALKQPEFVFNRIARLQRENLHAPLRMLWLPDAQFLRSHSRFEETIGKAGLTALWHGSAPPDICEREPRVYGCNLTGYQPLKPRAATSP